VSESNEILASVVGREARDGGTTVEIEAWEPFGPAMCDVRVRAGARVYWTALYTLRPTSGSEFPRRAEVCEKRRQESLTQLREIRAQHVRDFYQPWSGAEHGKALVGSSIDGAIADLERSESNGPRNFPTPYARQAREPKRTP